MSDNQNVNVKYNHHHKKWFFRVTGGGWSCHPTKEEAMAALGIEPEAPEEVEVVEAPVEAPEEPEAVEEPTEEE